MKNKSKYKLSLFFIFAISIFCLKNTDVFAKTIINNNIEYTLSDKEGTAKLTDGKHAQGSIEIPSEITHGQTSYKVSAIDDEAFIGSALEGIIIPESIESIGKKAFYECKKLLAVSLPESNLRINDYAFYSSSITDLKIPTGTTYLGSNAFSNCDKLKSVSLPGSVSYIPLNAFSWCTSLESVKISSGVREIQDMAFYHCTNLVSIEIPDTVTFTLGNSAFEWCQSLKTITLPESLTAIGNKAFNKCKSLESIVIPSGVSYIGDYAFNDCGIIDYIELPESINYVGNSAFGNSGNGEATKIKKIICIKNSFVDNEDYFYSWNQYGISCPEFSYKVSSASASGSIFGEYTFMSYISVFILLALICATIVILFKGKKNFGLK